MKDDWSEVSLKDITTVLGDGLHGTPKYDDSGDYHFINGNNLENGRIVIRENTKRVNEEQYLKHRKQLNDRTLMVSINGTIGNVAFYNGEKVILGKSACYFNLIDGVDKRYIRYTLSGRRFLSYLEQFATGTTIKNVSLKSMRDFPIKLPPLVEQQRIAHILGTLDDKIELNRQMNETLEAMAQALFKSWFVDFDPVIDNALAAGNEIPESLQKRAAARRALGDQRNPLPTDIQSLFPDRFVFTDEMGWVPQGWSAGVIGDICSSAIGGQWGEEGPVDGLVPAICLRGVDMEHLRSKGLAPAAPIRYIKPSAIEKRLCSELDVYVGGSGAGPCGRPLWFSSKLKGLFDYPLLYSNFVKRFTAASVEHAIYLDRLLFNMYSDGSIEDFITGTSVPNLDANGLLSGCRIVVPDNAVLTLFATHQRAFFDKLYSEESTSLSNLRDILIPKLLSGELRIPDAEKQVAEAV